ncbi:RNA-directed DNA polymerase, eukaryota [Tanacetum coccineum]
MLSDSLLYLESFKLDHRYILPISLPELFVTSHGGTLAISLMHRWHDTICGGVIGLRRSVWMHLRDREAEVFQVSNDDTAVAQRWLEDKQPEEKTNTDCLVKEREKVHLGIKVGANITVTRVPGQEGAEGGPRFEVPALDEDAEYRLCLSVTPKVEIDFQMVEAQDYIQKAKVHWAIEGDENSKFYHGIINRKRSQLSIKGIMMDGVWVDDPSLVKDEFRSHFAKRFLSRMMKFAMLFGVVVITKSPGPGGFTFEFFRKFWNVIGPDFCAAVDYSAFAKGCNSSFIALIPKTPDAKFVGEFRPISLIGSLYKVITKILANRLSNVISDLVADVQTAFLPNRQILDGPFIVNEVLSWCKFKQKQAMVFKVDFAKAYDSVRWDFLDDVLEAFGFGFKWRSWVLGSLSSGMASIVINGSPTAEFKFHCGLKQGDPLAPYLFILIMESLHLSFSRVIDAGLFKGIKIDHNTQISHLFYADDAIFIGEWSDNNIKFILHVLHCFSLASGLKINLKKSNLLGFGVSREMVNDAASSLGCAVMRAPFKYLGVMVGGNMSMVKTWDEVISKLKTRLSKWKCKALSIGGRLTLLKSVLGSTPIYNLSLYKAPKTVLNTMESIRRNFFYGSNGLDTKITWVKWSKILAAKKCGGLGVSSYFALNRALLFKWVWRFISFEKSCWSRVIHAIHGPYFTQNPPRFGSVWGTIVREIQSLNSQGIDLLSFCRIRVGNGLQTRFWKDHWIGDAPLYDLFPRLFSLEMSGDVTVATKLHGLLSDSFRRPVRGGIEAQQLAHLQNLVGTSILSNSDDRWVCNLNGDGSFQVKNIRCLLDEYFLPNDPVATRWVKFIPIKINVFAWRVYLDRLPTRLNLNRRNIQVLDQSCPVCKDAAEEVSHLFFSCPLAVDVHRLICRWWNLTWSPLSSYEEWLSWFKDIRLGSILKCMLEGHQLPQTVKVLELDLRVLPGSITFGPTLTNISLVLDLITDVIVRTIAQYCPLLVELELIDMPTSIPRSADDLSDVGVQSLVGCRHLTSLSIIRKRQFVYATFTRTTHMGMIILSEGCKGLESMRLHGFSGVDDAGVTSILNSYLNLKIFDIQDAFRLTDLAIKNVSMVHRPLVEFKLVSCSSITCQGVRELVTSSTSLEVLDFHGCRIADSCLSNVSCLTSLTSLNTGSTNVTNAGMAVLGKGNAPITCLSLRGCRKITDEGITFLLGSEGKIGKTLSSLDLSDVFLITDNAVTVIIDACVRLIELCVRNCFMVTDEAMKTLALRGRLQPESKLLRRLDIFNCPGVSEESFEYLKKPLFRGLQWIGIKESRLIV